MSATEILTLTVSIVCPVCSLIIAMVTMFNKNKKDIKQEEQKHGSLLTELEYIKSSIDRIEMKINNIDTKQVELTQRLIIVETKLNEHIDNKMIHNIKGEQLWALKK